MNVELAESIAQWLVYATVPFYLVAGLLFLVARDWTRGVAFICWGIANAALAMGRPK